MTLKEAMQRLADGWAEAPPWAGGGPSPADLFIKSLKGEGKFQAFDPRADGPSVIRICPPQSRDSLLALHGDSSLSLPSLVAGGRGVDMLTPTDIYATVLDPGEPAEWRLTAFAVPPAKNVSLADVSPGIDTVTEGIVTFDKGTGVLRIDVTRLPSDEGWRLIALKYGTLFHEKAVVAVKRQPPETSAPDDPAADVVSGHLLRAWRSAAAKADAWQPRGLTWLVGNVFAKMQSLIVGDIMPNAKLRGDEFDWVLDHLQQTVDRRLDSIKQGVWDTFTH